MVFKQISSTEWIYTGDYDDILGIKINTVNPSTEQYIDIADIRDNGGVFLIPIENISIIETNPDRPEIPVVTITVNSFETIEKAFTRLVQNILCKCGCNDCEDENNCLSFLKAFSYGTLLLNSTSIFDQTLINNNEQFFNKVLRTWSIYEMLDPAKFSFRDAKTALQIMYATLLKQKLSVANNPENTKQEWRFNKIADCFDSCLLELLNTETPE